MSDTPLTLKLSTSDWKIESLFDVSVFIKDGTHGTHVRTSSGIPLLSAKNITASGQVKWDTNDSLISESDYSKIHSKYELEKNDLLLTVVGTLGRKALVDSPVKFTIQRSVAVIRAEKSKIESKFVFHYCGSDFFQNQLELRSNATAQAGVYLGELGKISIPVPPLPEQQKIAAILTSVDEVIEKTQAQCDKLKDLKTAMMQELLTKGVGINGKPHTEFKDSLVGRIPKGWEVVTVGELLKKQIIISIQDGNHGEKHPKSADFVSQGIPFVMASDIHNQMIDIEGANKIPEKIYQNLRIGFAKAGDVLLSHKATVGLTAVVPDNIERLMLTPQVTYYRIGNSLKLLNWYLHYVFQSTYFQEKISLLSAQSTRSYIGIKAQRELEIVLPGSIEEQRKIVNVLQSVDDQINLKKSMLLTFKNTKKALMQDLLTGKVRVTVPTPPSAKAS